MATSSSIAAAITPPRVPLIDPRTGQIDRTWYLFFYNLFNGSTDNTDVISAILQRPESNTDVSQIEQTVQSLSMLTNTLQSQVATVANDLQALALTPVQTPTLRQRRYGSFYDTTTQTAAAINTAYAMTFNTTDLSAGVYIGSPTSRVYVDRAGVYNIQFSAQLDNTSGGDHLAWIWLRVNGTDVANTAGEVRLKANNAELVAAWNFLYNFKADDYFQLMWAVGDTGVQIKAVAAAAPVPAIPSVILTVTDNINPYQD